MTGSCGPGSETRGLKRIEKIRKIGDITDQSGGNCLNLKASDKFQVFKKIVNSWRGAVSNPSPEILCGLAGQC